MTQRIALITTLLFSTAALSQVPSRIAYQGRLLTADGTPENGSIKITFALYSGETDTVPLWTEEQSVLVSSGYYSVFLGDVMPVTSTLMDGTERFLELTIGGNPLRPRQRIVSVPYAMRAQSARDVSGGAVNASSVSINGAPVIDGTGNLTGAALAHVHSADQITSGTLALARVPQGPGSGLDSDTVDGVHGSALTLKTDLSTAGTLNAAGNPVDWTRLKAVPTASGSSSGILSSTDWTTFNSKVATNDARLSDSRAPTAGSTAYLQNQTAVDQPASFRIAGTGAITGAATLSGGLTTGGTVRIGSSPFPFTAIRKLTVTWDPPSSTGNLTMEALLPAGAIFIGAQVPAVGVACGGFGCYYAVGGMDSGNNWGGGGSFTSGNDPTTRVRMVLSNLTGGAIDPPSSSWDLIYIAP